MDPRAVSDTEARLNLGAVYTALLTLSRDQTIHFGAPEGRSAGPPLSALEMLNRNPRLVLLGDPGSGKSTFVNFVALCLSGEGLGHPDAHLKLLTAPLPQADDERPRKKDEKPQPQPWGHGALIPVRLILRDFAARGQRATADHLWQFIAGELRASALPDYAPHLRAELMERGGLLLLDGLDEVPEADQRRAQIKQAVEDFAATFRRCRILVTSRTYAYQKQDWRLPSFNETVLAPFSAGQIRNFVDRWYAHIAVLRNLRPDEAQGRAELLKRAIFGSDRLSGLAERPLLLTLMASLHAWRGGSLPEKREELYAEAVDLLLDQWERPKVVRDAAGQIVMRQPSLAEWLKADKDKVRGLLNELAFKAHAAQPDLAGTADVPEGELVSGLMRLRRPDVTINPAELVDYLSQRAGLLLPRGVSVYTFPHRTFQEYLAACHLTDHEFPDKVAELARTNFNRWREVALLAGAKAARGAVNNVWQLAEALCFLEPADAQAQPADAWGAHLAAQALVETARLDQVSPRDRPKLARAKRWLVHILERNALPTLERVRAGDTLAQLGDPRDAVMTMEGMEFCYVPPGPFVMGDGKEKHANARLNYGYWLARYPVTQAQFKAFTDAGGYAERRYWPEAEAAGFWKSGQFQGHWDDKPRAGPIRVGAPFDLPNHPVVGLSWYEALAFCRWLTERFKAQLPTEYRLVLPSEAEWEKAARGGAQIPNAPLTRVLKDGLALPGEAALIPNPAPERDYPWEGEFSTDKANTEETKAGTTSATGCFALGASLYGTLDLAGNVWEWTRSHDKGYPYNPKDGREDLNAPDNVGRVLRGGSFFNGAGDARCAVRSGNFPDFWFRGLGFRVVASPFRL